jgi:Ras-related C3 botulinum toxin substrate 1
MSIEHLKVVITGDGAVGKTALVITYVNGTFPADYLPTVADKFQKNMTLDGRIYSLSLWDTAGQEEYTRLRVLSYPDTNIFLVCFSTVELPSFHNIREKWMIELKHYCPNVPKILVGTKVDLREERKADGADKVVTPDMGRAMAQQQNMADYLECSAKTKEGIDALFQQVVRVQLDQEKKKQLEAAAKKKSTCTLL